MLSLLAIALLSPVRVFSQIVTITATGTIYNGGDTAGIFGAAGASLKGEPFVLVMTFNGSKGTIMPEPFQCDPVRCASQNSGARDTSPGTAVLSIKSKEYVFGTALEAGPIPNLRISSNAMKNIGKLPNMQMLQVGFAVTDHTGSVGIEIKLNKPADSAINPDWRAPFCETGLAAHNLWNGEFEINNSGVLAKGYLAIDTLSVGDGANGCDPPAALHPVVGDIVIYRDGQEVTHSGVISQVTPGAKPDEWIISKVISKWGAFWGLYEHDPNDVPLDYGDWTVYHTARGSNLLKTYASVFFVTDTYAPPNSTLHVVANQFDNWVHVLGNATLSRDDALAIIGGLKWWANPSGVPTDAGGSPLSARLTPLRDPSLAYDCHGYTFADSAVNIHDIYATYILTDNKYKALTATDTHGRVHPAQ